MHSDIMGIKTGCEIDHIDGNSLNNCRNNLRHVTRRQNMQNKHVKKTSKFPGVHWHYRARKWRSQITINRKCISLGYFDNERDAFMAYKKATLELTGEHVISIVNGGGGVGG